MQRLTDAALLRVIRWCLHRISDRAAYRLWRIMRGYYSSERGIALIGRLERGEL